MAGKSGKKAKAAQELANARSFASSLSVADELAEVLAALPGTPAILGAPTAVATPAGESIGFSVEFDVLTGLLAPILARVESLETRLSDLASTPRTGPAPTSKSARKATAAVTDFEPLTVDEIAKLSSGLASHARASLALALVHEESLSPSELGHATKLATGSLYHHLREMVAAGVLTHGERNQYELSPAGRRILQALTRTTTPANPERLSREPDA